MRRRRGNNNNRNEKEEERRGVGGGGEGKTIEFYYPKTHINDQCSTFFSVYILLVRS